MPPSRILPSADSSVSAAAVACPDMRGSDQAKPDLTERQLQIVVLIARGCSNDEVGERLGISPRTAKAHCDVLRQKLGVPRRRQIPAAFKALTGEDPLARELAPALAGAGG
jgi:LuxR family maltose regulon positive regulatory protein